MSPATNAPGAAVIGVMHDMAPWEAALVRNLRRWCDGPGGQRTVCEAYLAALPAGTAEHALQTFETLVVKLISTAHRPLVRHGVSCACVGADEGVFVTLVRYASEGHLNDAALIATLLAGPAQAEHLALLAGEVGMTSRRISEPVDHPVSAGTDKVMRLI